MIQFNRWFTVRFFCYLGPLLFSLSNSFAGVIIDAHFIPLTEKEKRLEQPHPASVADYKPAVFADRDVYWNDDGCGQFLAAFFFCDLSKPDTKVQLELADAKSTLESQSLSLPSTNQAPKVSFFLNTDVLNPGNYELRAALLAGDGSTITNARPAKFVRADKSHSKAPIPSAGIPLVVHSQNHLASAVWPV